MSDLDLDALAALARAATPGPWSVVNDCVVATTEAYAHGSSLTEVIADVLTRPDPIEPADAPEVDPRTVEVGWLVERRKGESVMRARVGFANGVQLDTPGAVLWWGGAARQGWTLHVIDRGESA